MSTSPTGKVTRIHAGEFTAMALSFAYFFFILSGYYTIRPLREQLASAVGSTQLPWFYLATFATTLVLTPVFAWLASRWPRRVLVPAVFLFFMTCLVAFYPMFLQVDAIGAKRLGTLFFVWVSVFNLFIVSVFWSFMSDIWQPEQAQRLFPLIGLGGTLGAITGPTLTRSLVPVLGVAPMLLVSLALLAGGLACVILLGRWTRASAPDNAPDHDGRAIGGGMWDGLLQIVRNPFVRATALLMLLGDMIGTIAYALVTDYAKATFATDAVARTRFAADVDLYTNVLQVVVQLTLTRCLLGRVGASRVFVVWGVVATAVCVVTALVAEPYAPVLAGMPWVVWMLIVTRGLAYGMYTPAKESLFTRVPRSLRYKGKNAVETAVWRAGDVLAALTVNLLNSLRAAVPAFAAVGAAALAISGVISWQMARRAERGDFDK